MWSPYGAHKPYSKPKPRLRFQTREAAPLHTSLHFLSAAEQGGCRGSIQMASFYYYSITDLADNTEYGSASIHTVDREKIHEFGRRVLQENGMEERTAVVYPFGGDSKACAPSKEVGNFLPNSGVQDRPFVVHLKAQQEVSQSNHSVAVRSFGSLSHSSTRSTLWSLRSRLALGWKRYPNTIFLCCFHLP